MITFLNGYKTYIVGGAALVVCALALLGIVPTDTANTLLTILGFGSVITLRSAIAASAPILP